MEIKYHIGRECNLRCSYCHVKKNNSHEDYSKVLDDVISSLNVKDISKLLITGGEPTLYHEQILKILDKYKNIERINIPSNGTNVDKLIDYLLHYKNVMVTISYDGHINERGYDSFESIKKLYENGLRCNVLYVINNTNYNNIYNDICELGTIIKNVDEHIELLFVALSEEDYNMDIDVLEKEIEKLYENFPNLNIFKRNKIRKCPIIHNNDYQIEIRDGIVYKGCINYAYIKTIADYKLKDCSSEIENKCFNCDIDVCQACGNTIVGHFSHSHVENIYDGEYFNSYYCKFYRLIHKVITKKNKDLFLKNKIQQDAENLILMLTNNCNLRCVYCIEKGKHKNITMSKEIFSNIVDLIKDNKNMKSLMLFGGEPLMKENIDLLNFISEKLLVLNKNIEIVIMTNGQDLSEEPIINFIKKLKDHFKVRVQISIDNLKEINDKRRISLSKESSFDKAFKGIETLNKILDYKSISINSVMDYENLESFYEWCIYLNDIVENKIIGGFSIRYDQLRKETLSIIEQKEFGNFYTKICKDFLKNRISINSFKSIMNIKKITCNQELIKNDSGCEAGIKSFSINSNGDILICHLLDEEPIGKITKGKIESSENMYDIFDKICCSKGNFRSFELSCNDCKDFETCIKCKVSNYLLYGNVRENNRTNCRNVKERNNIMRNNEIELSSFKALSIQEREDLIKDIKELEKIYYKSEKEMSEEEKNIFLKEVLKLKERLLY